MSIRLPLGFARVALLSLLFLGVACSTALAQKSRVQNRPSLERVEVPVEKIRVSDGDTMVISWSEDDKERVRVLGIDTPEIGHENHFISEDQAFGPEASEFAKQLFAAAESIQLLRAEEADGYGRTLGYFFLDGENYSVLVVAARLAYETVKHYGDNGLPEEAEAVLAAWEIAQEEGELPFEPPYKFRQQMREKQKAEEESSEEKSKEKSGTAEKNDSGSGN